MDRRKDRTGERRVMTNGLEAEIIAYRNVCDIDVSFMDSRCVSRNKEYKAFKQGKIRCPLWIEEVDGHLRVTNFDVKEPFTFLVSVEDRGIVDCEAWSKTPGGYVVNWKWGRLASVIMKPAMGLQVDHINHDTLDNRRENLRICTEQQNKMNRRPERGAMSKYKGVCPKKGKWRAVLCRKELGMFDTEIEAAIAYNNAAFEKFGEFAYLNNIEDIHGVC